MRINPYRRSVTPYRVPIAVPPCDPDFQPVSVEVSCQWLAYIVGALAILTEQATWDTSDPDVMLEAIQRANNLREIFTAAIDASACSDFNIPFSCPFDFTLTDGDFYVSPTYNFGAYISGDGFESTHASSISEQVIVIDRDFPSQLALTRIDLTIDAAAAGSGSNNSVALYSKLGAGFSLLQQFSLLSGVNHYVWTGQTDLIDGIEIQTNSGTSSGGSHTITHITLQGLGGESVLC